MVESRRRFLAQGAGGAAAALLGALSETQHAAGREIQRVTQDTDDSFRNLRGEYLLDERLKYLNHASIGTIPRAVHNARREYLDQCEANPWLAIWGGGWSKPKEQVRAKAAGLLNCEADEISITHNTTEAFNTLAQGLPLGAGDEVLCSSLSHTGAMNAFVQAAPLRGYKLRRFGFPVDRVPQLTAEDVVAIYEKQIRDETKLLIFPHVDNLVGIRYPVRRMAQMARDRGVEFVAVDAAQSVGMLPVDVTAMGVDVLATSPHKWLQAPKGLGLAFFHKRLFETLQPLWVSWGLRRDRGSGRRYEDYGTRNLPEVLALGDAIDFHVGLSMDRKQRRLKELWQHARSRAEQDDRIQWASPDSWELSASLFSVQFQDRDSNELFRDLYRDHGFVFRPFRTQGLNAIRISPNVANTEQELDELFDLATRG